MNSERSYFNPLGCPQRIDQLRHCFNIEILSFSLFDFVSAKCFRKTANIAGKLVGLLTWKEPKGETFLVFDCSSQNRKLYFENKKLSGKNRFPFSLRSSTPSKRERTCRSTFANPVDRLSVQERTFPNPLENEIVFINTKLYVLFIN